MFDSKKPTISVIITVYNSEKYISEAVQSILDQTYDNFELIIIDDGSTDNSLDILTDFARTDKRIRLISRENKGIVVSSNEGVSLAQGKYIARMDSDDISVTDRFEKQLNFLIANPSVVAASGWYQYMDEKGRKLTTIKMPLDNESIQKSCMEGVPALCHGAVMIRQSALKEICGYDSAFKKATEDLDLFLRLGEVGELGNISDTILKVRLHSQSIGARKRQLQFDMARFASDRACKRRGIDVKFVPAKPWRSGEDNDSQFDFLIRCGWWAFNAGERMTAIIYSVKAIKKNFMRSMAWRLFICSLIKKTTVKKNAQN